MRLRLDVSGRETVLRILGTLLDSGFSLVGETSAGEVVVLLKREGRFVECVGADFRDGDLEGFLSEVKSAIVVDNFLGATSVGEVEVS